jgi:hypothetical protein
VAGSGNEGLARQRLRGILFEDFRVCTRGCRERRRLDTLGFADCRLETNVDSKRVGEEVRGTDGMTSDYVQHKDEARGRGEDADQCGKEEVKVRRQRGAGTKCDRGTHAHGPRTSVAHTGFGFFW